MKVFLDECRTDLSCPPLIRTRHESPEVFVLCPRSFAPHILVLLATFPMILWLCHRFQAEWSVTIGFALFPILGACGFGVAEFLQRFTGLRARFDRTSQVATINDETISFPEIHAIQMLERVKEFEDGKEIVRQVNLVRIAGGKTTRLNLLQGTQPELIEMARGLSRFLEVRVDEHLVEPSEFSAITTRPTIRGVILCVLGGVFLIVIAGYLVVALRQPINRNIVGAVSLGACFVTLAALVFLRLRREIRLRR